MFMPFSVLGTWVQVFWHWRFSAAAALCGTATVKPWLQSKSPFPPSKVDGAVSLRQLKRTRKFRGDWGDRETAHFS